MPDKLVSPSSGLSNSKLAKANASTGDVLSGKSFYAGDKNLKTGSMVNRGSEQIGGGFAWDNDFVYIQPIPEGYYHRINQESWWDPRVKIDKQKLWELLGGNHGSWGTTINPGGSVTIPRGYHDGNGVVRANNAQSQLKRGTVSHFFSGSDWAQRATLHCAGTVIGITDVRGTGSVYVNQTVTFNNCPDGRGIRIRISGSDILVEADNLVSTNTMWIDYVYI